MRKANPPRQNKVAQLWHNIDRRSISTAEPLAQQEYASSSYSQETPPEDNSHPRAPNIFSIHAVVDIPPGTYPLHHEQCDG